MAAVKPSRAGDLGADAGFTLTELLVVLALIGLLTLAAPALMSAARPGVTAMTAARALAGELRVARQVAAISGRQTDVVLDPVARSYSLRPDGRTHFLAPGVTAELVDVSGEAAVIRFFPDGSSSGGRIRVWSASSVHWVSVHFLSGKVVVDE